METVSFDQTIKYNTLQAGIAVLVRRPVVYGGYRVRTVNGSVRVLCGESQESRRTLKRP